MVAEEPTQRLNDYRDPPARGLLCHPSQEVLHAGGLSGRIAVFGRDAAPIAAPNRPDRRSNLRAALCAGCGGKISDRYYLLAVDKQWHMRCLKCCECKLNLESELTCFSKDGSIYCKEDYYR